MVLGSHVLVVGKVVETYYNDLYLTEGKLDINKVKPVVSAQFGYYGLGEKFGDSFKIGSSINPEKVKAARKSNPPPPPR